MADVEKLIEKLEEDDDDECISHHGRSIISYSTV
jgi:hypothetical protein